MYHAGHRVPPDIERSQPSIAKESERVRIFGSPSYWALQLLGWFGFCLTNLPLGAPIQTVSARLFLSTLLLAALGLAATHILRELMHRGRWLDLPARTMIPILLLAVLSTAVLWRLITQVLLHGLDLPAPRLMLGLAFGTGFGEIAMIGSWVGIYLGTHYFRRYRASEIALWRLAAVTRELELNALKSQLNPHFLFNALNSIRALVTEQPQRCREAVTQLSTLLRHILTQGEPGRITIEEELHVVRQYLELERLRYEQRLQYSIDVAPEALPEHLPAMLLQTLVENAVKHGVSKMPAGGVIQVNVAFEDDYVVLSVINPGHLGKQHSGLGLRNAGIRLEAMCGKAARLSLQQLSPTRVRAIARWPSQGSRQ